MLKFKIFTSPTPVQLEIDIQEWIAANPSFSIQDYQLTSIGTPTVFSHAFTEASKERHTVLIKYIEL